MDHMVFTDICSDTILWMHVCGMYSIIYMCVRVHFPETIGTTDLTLCTRDMSGTLVARSVGETMRHFLHYGLRVHEKNKEPWTLVVRTGLTILRSRLRLPSGVVRSNVYQRVAWN